MASDEYLTLPGGPDEEEDDVRDKKPWGRLCALLLSCALASGMCPGAAVWMTLLGNAGVFAHSCDSDIVPCGDQFLTMGLVFTVARLISTMLIIVSGILFDLYGGRFLGITGGGMVLSGFFLLQICIWGAKADLDFITAYFLLPIVLLIDAGSVFSSQAVLSILFHFPNIAGVILALLGATVDVAALLPVFVELAMSFLDLQLSSSLMIYTIGVAMGVVGFYLCCPTREEYLEQAEKVLGQKISARTVSIFKVVWDGHRVLAQNLLDHVFFIVILCLVITLFMVYCNVLCDYAVHLFHDPAATAPLANISVTLVVFNGIFAVPCAARIAETYGAIVLVLSLLISTWVGVATILRADWLSQTICLFVAIYVQAALTVFAGLRALAFASPNKFGTVQGLYALYLSSTLLVLTITGQIWLGTLPQETRYETGFSALGSVSVVGITVYSIYFGFTRLPSSPVLLPEEVEEICVYYGCHRIVDIAYILHFEHVGDTNEFRGMLSTSDPELHSALVLSIDRERISQKMNQLGLQDFRKALQSGFEWRRDLTKVDMNHNVFNIANMRKVLNHAADLTKFGKGSAKTVDQFEAEVMKGRSKLMTGSDGQMTRLVDLVALRIFNHAVGKEFTIVQTAEKFADGRERSKLQLPGTKKGPGDTLEVCVEKICRKIGIDARIATFSYDDIEVSQRELESTSYPGIFTIYNKTIVSGYISTTDVDALARLGLPACKQFTMQAEDSKMTYLFEWMEEARAREMLGSLDVELQKQKTSVGSRTSAAIPHESSDQTLGKVKTLAEIMWSLQVRDLTKTLLKFLRSDDKKGFENWLLAAPVDNIRSALRDIVDWPGYDAEKVFKYFHDMLPNEDLLSILGKRQSLQPVITELYLGELEREQKKLRQSTKRKLCALGHPYWPFQQKSDWTCDSCAKKIQLSRDGTPFRCNHCQLNVCKECFAKVKGSLPK